MANVNQSAPPEPRESTSESVESVESVQPERRERVGYGAPPEEHVIPQPVGLYYAFLAGGALATVGLLGLIPPFTQGGVLFNIMHVSTIVSVVHLVTGLAGIGVFFLGKRRYATIYAALIGAIYLVIFSNGNVDYGNLSSTFGANSLLLRIQWIVFNGFHAGLMLASWLVAALSAMQKGDRATREYRSERRWFLESRSRAE